MPEKPQLPPSEATANLLEQFEQFPGVLEQAVETDRSLSDAVCDVTFFVVTESWAPISDGVPQPDTGPETEHLEQWHSSLQAECVEKFEALRTQNPDMSEREINLDKELQLLNGVRRGVYRALVRNQDLSTVY